MPDWLSGCKPCIYDVGVGGARRHPFRQVRDDDRLHRRTSISLFLVFENKGAFVAKCSATWRDEGPNQQSQSSEYMTAGESWTVTLPDTARNLHLHVEHATGLVWNPWYVTGDMDWRNPPAEFRNGRATVEAYGATLSGYGLTWVDQP